jgi:hypothetical protein
MPLYRSPRDWEGKIRPDWEYSPDDDNDEEFVDQEWYNEVTENWVAGTTPKEMGGKVITFVL